MKGNDAGMMQECGAIASVALAWSVKMPTCLADCPVLHPLQIVNGAAATVEWTGSIRVSSQCIHQVQCCSPISLYAAGHHRSGERQQEKKDQQLSPNP